VAERRPGWQRDMQVQSPQPYSETNPVPTARHSRCLFRMSRRLRHGFPPYERTLVERKGTTV